MIDITYYENQIRESKQFLSNINPIKVDVTKKYISQYDISYAQKIKEIFENKIQNQPIILEYTIGGYRVHQDVLHEMIRYFDKLGYTMIYDDMNKKYCIWSKSTYDK